MGLDNISFSQQGKVERKKLKVALGETLYWFAKKCENMHYYNCNYHKDRQMAKQLM